jgi:hypothetical protein
LPEIKVKMPREERQPTVRKEELLVRAGVELVLRELPSRELRADRSPDRQKAELVSPRSVKAELLEELTVRDRMWVVLALLHRHLIRLQALPMLVAEPLLSS